jgi:nucleoside-diphosphate-sugar epimerase
MSSLLVIGGTGYFGASIIDAFLRGLLAKWGINELHIASRGLYRMPVQLNLSKVNFHKLDIVSCEKIPAVNYVIHAAAPTNEDAYLAEASGGVDIIRKGAENYARLLKKSSLDVKTLFVSSGAVYGGINIEQGCPEDSLFNFSEKDYPVNKKNYAFAKISAENEFKALGRDGFNVSIARCFSFVGNYLPRDKHFALGNFIEGIIHHKKITVKSKKQVYRSYMHSDDLVHWLLKILVNSTVDCPIYNVGSPVPYELHSLAAQLAVYYQCELDAPKSLDQAIDFYVPTVLKAKNELELDININLFQAIDMVLQNYD